jgi:hypothetical protein
MFIFGVLKNDGQLNSLNVEGIVSRDFLSLVFLNTAPPGPIKYHKKQFRF